MPNSNEIPWKRLAAEAAAIIVSILLAFSIDAWWEQRQREAETRNTISNLVIEFADSAGEFERVISANRMVIEAADGVLEALASESAPVLLDPDNVAGLLMVPTTDPQRGVLDALIASGDIGWIPNEKLRRALANWPAALDDLIEEERAAQVFVHEHLMRSLGGNADLSGVYQELQRNRLSGIKAQGVPEELSFFQREYPVTSNTVRVDRPEQFIGLVQTRRHLSLYVLFDYAVLLNEYNFIVDQLEAMSE